MRVLPVCCVLLVLLVAAERVEGDGQFVKLCGREFIRAVIYTCGGSRWRRLLSDKPQDMTGSETDRRLPHPAIIIASSLYPVTWLRDPTSITGQNGDTPGLSINDSIAHGQWFLSVGEKTLMVHFCACEDWPPATIIQLWSPIDDRESFFAGHTADEDLTGPLEYQVQKINSQNYEDQQPVGSLEDFWGTQKNSVQERRDLNELLTTACCKSGCKKKDLSSLC